MSKITVKVNKNDPTVFSDPRWALLTNGALGKTWIVNMVTQAPFAFAGSNILTQLLKETGHGFQVALMMLVGLESKIKIGEK